MTAVLSPLRAGRITGSRVAAILGSDPYRNAEDVLREMVRQHFGEPEEFTGNWLTDWGHEHEPDALRAYVTDTGHLVWNTGPAQETLVHPRHDFLAATPDGLVGDAATADAGLGVLEVKCPRLARHVHIADRPDYNDQLQLLIEVTGAGWCDFVIWRPDGTRLGRIDTSLVMPDPTWLTRNLPALAGFHERYLAVIADDQLAAPYRKALIDVRTDEAWALAATDYLDLLMAKKALDERVEDAKAVLAALAGDEPRTRGYGVAVTQSVRKGAVEWARFRAENAPEADPEDYRKDPIPVVTVRQCATEAA